MKIAMVSEHANPLAALGGADAGGQNVHVGALAGALAARGHRITVYTRRDSPDAPERTALCRGVTVELIPAGPAAPIPKDDLPPYMPRFADELAHRWSHDLPDVAHAHFWMSGRAACLAGEVLDVPVVQTYHALGVVKRRHQGDRDTSPPERIDTERWVGRACDRVIATCSDELFELIRLGVPRDRISVIPCGVDLSLFTPAGSRAGRPRGRRLLAVGRLVKRKGFDTVIRALALIPDAELLIAGGPPPDALDCEPEAARLRRLADRLKVADRVHLLGGVDRAAMPALLRSADIAVCVPWYEPFGMVPLEAMACGTPVVASAVGGLTDTVMDAVTGALVPPRDAEALAAELTGLLDDPARLAAYSAAGLRRVRQHYSWQRIAEKTAAVYARVAAPAPRTTEKEHVQ